jgi:uncharacterized membrane protein YgdD (TMEM256/DUF423 family)
MERTFAAIGAFYGLLAVVAGALGAHLLGGDLDDTALDWWHTAWTFQMYHALALLGAAWAVSRHDSTLCRSAGWLLAIGTLVFSGSLYAMALLGRSTGPLPPVGGVCLMCGWLTLSLALIFRPRIPRPAGRKPQDAA